MIQTRDNGGLDQRGSSGRGEKWSDSVYIEGRDSRFIGEGLGV